MSKSNFYIIDVFAENPLEGNQLAVFDNGKNFTSDMMQKIAREMNFSETTFITSHQKNTRGYPVRIFTPHQEVPFAGHPTLGTAYIIKRFLHDSSDIINLDLKGGSIPVSFEDEILWMKQRSPEFYSQIDVQTMASILSINKNEIDLRYPIEGVSTGFPFIIVPLKNMTAIKEISINKEKLIETVENLQAKAILTFCSETESPTHDLKVRVFCDYYGIAEDPATGSANGCLGAYCLKHNYFNKSSINIKVEQGIELKRKSTLYIKASIENNIDINVGGKVQFFGQGTI